MLLRFAASCIGLEQPTTPQEGDALGTLCRVTQRVPSHDGAAHHQWLDGPRQR